MISSLVQRRNSVKWRPREGTCGGSASSRRPWITNVDELEEISSLLPLSCFYFRLVFTLTKKCV
jgi:hypothetical protein